MPLVLAVCTAVAAPLALVARDCGRVSRDNAPVDLHGRSVIADIGLRGSCGCCGGVTVGHSQTIAYGVCTSAKVMFHMFQQNNEKLFFRRAYETLA